MLSKLLRISFQSLATLASVVACSKGEPLPASASAPQTTDASIRDASSKMDAVPQGSGGSGGGGGAPPVFFADGSTVSRPGTDGAAVCAATAFQAEEHKLDLLILMDGSGSMKDEVDGGRKWDLLLNALHTFVTDPDSVGIGVGLTFFGIPAGEDDAGDLVVSCNVADYAKPAIAIADLPGNAASLVYALAGYQPIGGTPTVPALEGAEQYASAWLAQHPTHRVIIVLATDGEPNDCGSTVGAVSTTAALGANNTPSIPTYVIGVGSSLTSLDQVATAGGTGHAYLVDTAQNTTARFIAAMNAIRGRAALPCEYAIPSGSDGGAVDTGKVNITFTASVDGGSGPKALILQVPGKSSCDPAHGGWYYDDPSAPKNIELCDASCTRAKSDFGGRIDVLVGCKTETISPK